MTEQVTKDTLSSTPRTDEAELIHENGGDVSDIFKAMRQLERELNEAKSLNATLERSNHRLRAKFDRSYP